MAILRIRDENGEVREVLALRGPKGEDGGATTETYNVTVTNEWYPVDELDDDGNIGDTFYKQSIEVPGMLATDNPIPGVAYGGDNVANKLYDECFGKLLHITTYQNGIGVCATDTPEVAFPLQLKVVR